MTQQPPDPDMEKPAGRVFVALAMSMLLAGLVVGGFATLQGPPVGDLTRIGGMSERAFGWQGSATRYAADHFHKLPLAALQASGTQGGILVFGDSFTDAEQAGTSWLNSLYAQTGHPIDFVEYTTLTDVLAVLASPAVQAAPPQAIVLQMGERTVFRRALPLSDGITCTPAPAPRRIVATPQTLEQMPYARRTRFDGFDELMSWGALSLRRRILASDKVLQATLSRDDLFSSSASNTLLIYHSDVLRHLPEALFPLTPNAARTRITCALRHVFHQAGDIGVFVLVAPDKRTIYESWTTTELPDKAIFVEKTLKSLNESRIIDAFEVLRAEVRSGRQDVYYPNDTHWNAASAQLIGEIVAKKITVQR